MQNPLRSIADRLKVTLDHGLSSGVKNVQGQVCVMAAIHLAENPSKSITDVTDTTYCVDHDIRAIAIPVNDGRWSSAEARTAGMRPLAFAMLGSRGIPKEVLGPRLADVAVRVFTPVALRAVAAVVQEPHKSRLLDAALRCEREGTPEAASAANYAASAASAAAGYAGYAASAANYAYAASAANHAAASAASFAANAASAASFAASAAGYAASAAGFAANTAAASADESLTAIVRAVVGVLKDVQSPGVDFIVGCSPADAPPA